MPPLTTMFPVSETCKCTSPEWRWYIRVNHSFRTFTEVETLESLNAANNANGMTTQTITNFKETGKNMDVRLDQKPGANNWELVVDWDGQQKTHAFNHDFNADNAGPKFELSWGGPCETRDFWFEVTGGLVTHTLPCDYFHTWDGIGDTLNAFCFWTPKVDGPITDGPTRLQGDPFKLSPYSESFQINRVSAANDSHHEWRGAGAVGELSIKFINGCRVGTGNGTSGSKWYLGGPFEYWENSNISLNNVVTAYPFQSPMRVKPVGLVGGTFYPTQPQSPDGTFPGRMAYIAYDPAKQMPAKMFSGTVSIDGTNMESFGAVPLGTGGLWSANFHDWGESLWPLTAINNYLSTQEPWFSNNPSIQSEVQNHQVTLSTSETSIDVSIFCNVWPGVDFGNGINSYTLNAGTSFNPVGGLAQTSTVSIFERINGGANVDTGLTIDLGIALANESLPGGCPLF